MELRLAKGDKRSHDASDFFEKLTSNYFFFCILRQSRNHEFIFMHQSRTHKNSCGTATKNTYTSMTEKVEDSPLTSSHRKRFISLGFGLVFPLIIVSCRVKTVRCHKDFDMISRIVVDGSLCDFDRYTGVFVRRNYLFYFQSLRSEFSAKFLIKILM